MSHELVSEKMRRRPLRFFGTFGPGIDIARDLVTDLTHLHVVHVLPTITASDPGMIWDVVDNDARKRNAERAFREGFAASPFHESDFHVFFGDPGQEIAAFAERLHADLIVIPSHGRSGLVRLLIGSVAERMAPSLTAPYSFCAAYPENECIIIRSCDSSRRPVSREGSLNSYSCTTEYR